MSGQAPGRIAVAGAGIAGLTAALAFASHGFSVDIFDRAPKLEEAGAGLQLSPNATRLLRRFGVLEKLEQAAVRPEAVVLRDGASLKELARIPLGSAAEKRWGAPYLAAHRADLQAALLARLAEQPGVRLLLGATLAKPEPSAVGGVIVEVAAGEIIRLDANLLIGADGVRSVVRHLVRTDGSSVFGREVAWRATVPAQSVLGRQLEGVLTPLAVTAFLRPCFHLIAYPVRNGAAINLAAFTKSASRHSDRSDGPAASYPTADLQSQLSHCAPPLRPLADASWSAWPIHLVDGRLPWVAERVALIGDAAHAMTPYAAQGAAMAIEDAVTLADSVATRGIDANALSAWENQRHQRVANVASRAALNRFAWHAAGPVALARNLVFAIRGGDSLARDLDWLYGWTPPDLASASPL